MCNVGRAEAGVFLLGLLRLNPENLTRLTLVAESLASFPCAATVAALASELQRVKGSSATRAYLRRIVDTLEQFPPELSREAIASLAADRRVGLRFRQRLRLLLAE
jgi:hypothetical protein